MATASLHKVNRNASYRIQYTAKNDVGAAIVTASVFDNGFVQHQIPQADRQYAWITASLKMHPLGVSAPLGFASKTGYTQWMQSGPTASFEFVPTGSFMLYLDGGDAYFGGDERFITMEGFDPWLRQDFVGMNIIIRDPVSSSLNTIGFDTGSVNTAYINKDIGLGLGGFSSLLGVQGEIASVLNCVISHRQGPYGWPSWKQIRGSQHPIMRQQRLHNTMSVNYSRDAGGLVDPALLYNVVEPPLSVKYRDTSFLTRAKNNIRYRALVPFSCLNSYFDNNTLNNYMSTPVDINAVSLDKVIGVYESLKDADPSLRAYNLQRIDYSEIVFPRGENTFLARTRGRENNIIDYWREKRADRTLATSTNSQNVTVENRSMWVMDARQDFVSGNAYTKQLHSVPTGGYGELQNPGAIYNMGILSHTTASALYNRPTPETLGNAASTVIFAGDTLWEAGKQANKPADGPFYASYDDYAQDLRAVGKDYAIIPEFRISDHMDYYITEKEGNFLATFPKGGGRSDAIKLSLTGSSIETSLTGGFYRTYGTSDFLKFFKMTDEKVANIADKDAISLTCNALMKFLPYHGFYPAQRTVQLANLFSQSYGAFIDLSGSSSDVPGESADGNLRTLLTPLFAPGILFNTIK